MDIDKIKETLENADINEQKIKQLSKLQTQAWNKLVAVQDVLAEMEELLSGTIITKAKSSGLPDHPKPGSAAEKLCKIVNSKTPMNVAEIAKKIKASEATVKQHLRYKCFTNVRGKGYLYTK